MKVPKTEPPRKLADPGLPIARNDRLSRRMFRGRDWLPPGGQNAIARVDPATRAVKLFPLPKDRRNANLNTATFDRRGMLWFTGQNGVYGRLDPKSGTMTVFDAPRGAGPYGIATTPDGQVFFASLAGNYLGQIDLETGAATVLEHLQRFNRSSGSLSFRG
jgi:virginiamycin B lyase